MHLCATLLLFVDVFLSADCIRCAFVYIMTVADIVCRAMLWLMDGTLMRGDDARRIQLCDLFLHEVENTRPHSASALGAVTNQGKTNRVSNLRKLCLLYLLESYQVPWPYCV